MGGPAPTPPSGGGRHEQPGLVSPEAEETLRLESAALSRRTCEAAIADSGSGRFSWGKRSFAGPAA